MPTTEKNTDAASSPKRKTSAGIGSAAQRKAAADSYKPTVVKLTARQVRELAKRGHLMRVEIEARYASMKVITEDDLKLRAR